MATSGATRASIHVRIRRQFLEEFPQSPTGFIDTAEVPDEIDQGYDEGCHRQLQTVIANAEMAGRIEDHGHPFLARYAKTFLFSWLEESSFALPSDFLLAIRLRIDGVRATFRPEWMTVISEKFPSRYGSTKKQPFYRITIGASGARLLIPDVYGGVWSSGNLLYYRLVTPIAFGSPPQTYTDVEDPWNDGPVFFATAKLLEKSQQKQAADRLYQLANECFNKIISPPMQAQA